MNRVIVYVMNGCGACKEYEPRFKRLAGPYRAQMPIHVFDLASPLSGPPERLGRTIKATPTTIILYEDGRELRRVGGLPDAEISKILERAVRR